MKKNLLVIMLVGAVLTIGAATGCGASAPDTEIGVNTETGTNTENETNTDYMRPCSQNCGDYTILFQARPPAMLPEAPTIPTCCRTSPGTFHGLIHIGFPRPCIYPRRCGLDKTLFLPLPTVLYQICHGALQPHYKKTDLFLRQASAILRRFDCTRL